MTSPQREPETWTALPARTDRGMSQLATGAAQPTMIEIGERQVAALQLGSPADPGALLVPGYTGSKEDFGPVLAPLAAAGFFVTAIDLPGQYESPDMASAVDYLPDALGAVVTAVCERLGGGFRLVGHSFGGLVCRAAAIETPGVVSSLVLYSSGPAQLGGYRRVTMDRLEPLLFAAGLPGVYAAMQAAAMADPGFAAPPADLADFLERRFLGGSPEMLQGMGDALRREPDRVAELVRTGVPVLVVHGANDDAWEPAVQHDMAERLGARYAVVPDAAHSAAIENPAGLVEALVDFWRSHA